MLTLLPILTQVIAIVIWALFLIMVGAPLGSSPVAGREGLGSKAEPADPSPKPSGTGRPSRSFLRTGRAAGSRAPAHRVPGRPLSRCHTR